MSRGGRGGARGGMRGQALPFELDPELMEAVDNGHGLERDSGKELFPDFGEMIMAAPVTEDEREQVRIGREMDAQRRAGPFWSGDWEQWAQYDAALGRSGENYDPFEDAATYGRKRTAKTWRPPDLSKVKLHKEFFPKCLWDVIGANDDEDEDEEGRPAKRQKKLGLAKKSALDKLAKFDERNEEGANAEAEDEEGEDENEEEGEELEQEPEDDNFEEDEDELDDYNAELYFDGGEEDYDEGGDDYGGGDEGY